MEVRDTTLEREAIFCCQTTKSKDLENMGIFNARLLLIQGDPKAMVMLPLKTYL